MVFRKATAHFRVLDSPALRAAQAAEAASPHPASLLYLPLHALCQHFKPLILGADPAQCPCSSCCAVLNLPCWPDSSLAPGGDVAESRKELTPATWVREGGSCVRGASARKSRFSARPPWYSWEMPAAPNPLSLERHKVDQHFPQAGVK